MESMVQAAAELAVLKALRCSPEGKEVNMFQFPAVKVLLCAKAHATLLVTVSRSMSKEVAMKQLCTF